MWFFKLIESFFKRERGEQGSGLMTVLGVSLVVTIAAGTITSSIVMASNMTADNLSHQQADAAAEAGIADAVHSYQTGNCKAYSSNDLLKYKYNFYRSNAENYPTAKGETGTYAGCPGDAGEGSGSKADRWVMIESIGYGKNNTTKTKTAVFKVTPEDVNVIPQAITGSTVGIMTGSKVQNSQGIIGDPIIYANERFGCMKDAYVTANIKYNSSDNWDSFENCTINGNIEAKIDNSETVSMDFKGMEVNGNICSNKKFQNIENVKGKNRTSINVPCNYEGTFYGYVPDMSNSTTISGNQCSSWQSLVSKLESLTGEREIIDLTKCNQDTLEGMLSDESLKPITLNSDITFVFKDRIMANKINVNYSKGRHSLNFVVSNSTPDSSSSVCPEKDNISVISQFFEVNYEQGTSGVIYSPCGVWISQSNIIGQVYGGYGVHFNPFTIEGYGVDFKYTPVGLPDAEKNIKDIGRAPDLIRVY